MDEKTFLEKVARFLESRVAPKAQALEENDKLPRELLGGLGELKAYGISVPVEYGGLALPLSVFMEMIYRIGRVSPSLGLLMAVPTIAAHLVARYGNEEQRRTLLPRLCQGKAFCAFAVAESGGEADKTSTHAASRGEGYLISGEKIMVSWGGEADYYFTTTRLEIDKDSNRPIVFLVPKGQAGITFSKVNDKMAFPAFVNRNVIFDKVRCSQQEILGRPGFGIKISDDGLQIGRLCNSTLALALAESCLEDALMTATRVRPTGKRLADMQAVEFQLAEMKIALESGRAMMNVTWDRFAENESEAVLQISAFKVLAARVVMELADRSLEMHGGWGYIKPSLAEQRFRQARIFSLLEGTTEIQLTNIAGRMLAGAA